MAIRMMGRLAAVVTLGVLMLGTPLTAAAAESSPTTEFAGSTTGSGELACDCTTDSAAPDEVLPPTAEPPASGTSAPEAPTAEPPAPGTSAPAPGDPFVDPTADDTSTIGAPSTTPAEGGESTPPPAVDGAVQPEIESPPDAPPLPTAPVEPAPAAPAPPETPSVALPASSIAPASETATTQQVPVPWDEHLSPTPFQSGSDTGNARWAAQSVSPAATLGAVSSAENNDDSAEPPAADSDDASREPGHAGARPRTAGPAALETTSGVEQTVTAGIAIMAPRGISSTVSVAVEFGRAGHGWAGAIVFNVWLRRQMRERRMSQRQLAHLSGVDHSTISRLVSGERVPSLATATRLARALGRVNGDGDAFAYFARLPEETVFPTTRVEMALRGDDEINDDDVRSLMSAYLDARTRRRRARQLTDVDNGASVRSPGTVDQTDTRSPPRRVLRGPKDASA